MYKGYWPIPIAIKRLSEARHYVWAACGQSALQLLVDMRSSQVINFLPAVISMD